MSNSSRTVDRDARVVRTHDDVLRAALQLLVDQGWEAVTHARVAQSAGYSRATLYNHWPTRDALLQGAFSRLAEMPHATSTGELRADLLAELVAYRDGMAEHRLDRALAVLIDLTASKPEMAPVRDRIVADGEGYVRRLLEPVLPPERLEAATLLLCGAVLQAALLHGTPPSDALLAATVDVVLSGLGL